MDVRVEKGSDGLWGEVSGEEESLMELCV